MSIDRPSDGKQKTRLSMFWRWMKLFVDVRTMNKVVCLWSDDEWIYMIVQHIKYWNIGRSINVYTLLICYDIIELNCQINSDWWTRESKHIIKQKDKLSCEKKDINQLNPSMKFTLTRHSKPNFANISFDT